MFSQFPRSLQRIGWETRYEPPALAEAILGFCRAEGGPIRRAPAALALGRVGRGARRLADEDVTCRCDERSLLPWKNFYQQRVRNVISAVVMFRAN